MKLTNTKPVLVSLVSKSYRLALTGSKDDRVDTICYRLRPALCEQAEDAITFLLRLLKGHEQK